MKQSDDNPRPASLNDGSEPKTNAIRFFHMALFVGTLALVVILALEWLLSRFCSDQVVVKAFTVGRVILSVFFVVGWISYEVERKSQFFSKRFWSN